MHVVLASYNYADKLDRFLYFFSKRVTSILIYVAHWIDKNRRVRLIECVHAH